MTEIRNYFAKLFIARNPPLRTNAGVANSADSSPAGRTITDTVNLSGGGQKVINLARGQELAQQARTAPVDENYAANLFKAQEDIFRITRLFTETIKAAFPKRFS